MQVGFWVESFAVLKHSVWIWIRCDYSESCFCVLWVVVMDGKRLL